MPPHSVLTPEERELVLREAQRDTSVTRIPIRTSGTSARQTSGGPSNAPRNPGSGGRLRNPPTSASATGGAGSVPRERIPPPRSPRAMRGRRTIAVIAALVLIVLGLAATKLLSVGSSVLSSERSILGQLADLLFRRSELQGETANRVNILLVAIGGQGHQGENLADTIILASFRPKEKDVALLSIPRDLYVKVPDTNIFRRVNAVHSYGENQQKRQGLPLLRKKISEISGQPVHYVARVDFIAFKRIVDEIGGISISIPESFYDYWHRINFPQGTEHMNGDRALAYVRARFVEGSEGGDFKRAARTQQVLLAIREKVMSAQTAVDLRALAGVLDTLHDNVSTNFTLAELKRLADLTRGIPDKNIHTAVLTTGPEGLIVGVTEVLDGRPASVLQPKAGLENYADIQALAADIFARAKVAPPPAAAGALPPSEPGTSPRQSAAASPSPVPTSIAAEQPTLELRNGTNITGLASRVAKAFEKKEFTIAAVGNAAIRNRTETIIVDRTGGKKSESLRSLLDALGSATAVKFPEVEKEATDASFVIFLGADVAEKFKK